MDNTAKNILVINRKPPYGSLLSREAIDTLLVASAYGLNVSTAYLDDGVFQLINAQQAEQIHAKNIAKMINAFEMYDVDKIYVDQDSMKQRGLQKQDFIVEVEVLNTQQMTALFQQQDQILSF